VILTRRITIIAAALLFGALRSAFSAQAYVIVDAQTGFVLQEH